MYEYSVGGWGESHLRHAVVHERLESEREQLGGVEETDSKLFGSQPVLLTPDIDPCEMFFNAEGNCSISCPQYHGCGEEDLL